MTLADLIRRETAGIDLERYTSRDIHLDDWWKLADAEAEVFRIDPEEWPLMITAYQAFECAFIRATPAATIVAMRESASGFPSSSIRTVRRW
jgi:hypothetical protein